MIDPRIQKPILSATYSIDNPKTLKKNIKKLC